MQPYQQPNTFQQPNNIQPNNPTFGGNWNGGNNYTDLAALQAQSMTRQQRLEALRLELNSVNNQIIQVKQGMAPGNIDINVLFQKEAELKRRMFET